MIAGVLYEVFTKLGVAEVANNVETIARRDANVVRFTSQTPGDWPGDDKKIHLYEVECPRILSKKACKNLWAHAVWSAYPLNVPFVANFLPRIINVLAARFLPRGTLDLAWSMLNRGLPGHPTEKQGSASGIAISHSAILQAHILRTIIEHFKRNRGSVEANALLWILLVKAWSQKEWSAAAKDEIEDMPVTLAGMKADMRKSTLYTESYEEPKRIDVYLDNCPIPEALHVHSEIKFRIPTYTWSGSINQRSGWFLYSCEMPSTHIARISIALDTKFTPVVTETESLHVCTSANLIRTISSHLHPTSCHPQPPSENLHASVYEIRIEFLRPASSSKHRYDVLSHLSLVTILTLLFGPGSLALTVKPAYKSDALEIKTEMPAMSYNEFNEMRPLFEAKRLSDHNFITNTQVKIKKENP